MAIYRTAPSIGVAGLMQFRTEISIFWSLWIDYESAAIKSAIRSDSIFLHTPTVYSLYIHAPIDIYIIIATIAMIVYHSYSLFVHTCIHRHLYIISFSNFTSFI